ncbi:MAG: hypothetical protein WCJ59_00190 [bacterium]
METKNEGAALEKPMEGALTPEMLEKLKGTGQKSEKIELSPEEKLQKIDGQVVAQQEEVDKLTESIKNTQAGLDAVREELKKFGLPPETAEKEKDPSILNGEERIKEKQAEQAKLEVKREEIKAEIEKQKEKEKAELIQKMKGEIMNEKLSNLFKEFQEMDALDLKSLMEKGKTKDDKEVESKSFGMTISPESAKILATAVIDGGNWKEKFIKAQENPAEFISKLEAESEQEAKERIEKIMEEAEKKNGNEEKKEVEGEKKPEGTETETDQEKLDMEKLKGVTNTGQVNI